MKRTDVEHLVRQMAWPEPPASLRTRVLSDVPIAEQPIVGAARVAGSRDPARRPPIARETARTGHRWRRAGVLVSLGLLLTFGSCTSLDVWANREVEAEIARIEARYGSLDVKTIRVPDVPVADNRARMVRAAAALAVGLQDRPYHYLGIPVPSPVPANLRAFADANREAIRLAAEIRNRHQSNWEHKPGDRGDAPWTGVTILGDAIYVSALLNIEAGRADEAASLIVSGLGIGASMRQETELWPFGTQAFQATRQLLTASAPSKVALKEVARWLNENRMPDGMRPMILARMKRDNDMFTRMEHGDVDRHTAEVVYPESWPDWPSAFIGIAAQVGRPFVRTAHLRYLQQMAQIVDLESGPRPRPSREEPPPPEPWAFVDRLTHRFADGAWGYSEGGDDFMAELSAAEVAVALRRFKLDHKAYPDTLSTLAPTYLVRLPIDPFTGQPPVYARVGEGFTLRVNASWPGREKWFALEWNVPR